MGGEGGRRQAVLMKKNDQIRSYNQDIEGLNPDFYSSFTPLCLICIPPPSRMGGKESKALHYDPLPKESFICKQAGRPIFVDLHYYCIKGIIILPHTNIWNCHKVPKRKKQTVARLTLPFKSRMKIAEADILSRRTTSSYSTEFCNHLSQVS